MTSTGPVRRDSRRVHGSRLCGAPASGSEGAASPWQPDRPAHLAATPGAAGARGRGRQAGARSVRGGARRAGALRPPMMQRPPTGPRPVTHSSPWLQHKATSPGGRFLSEDPLGPLEKAQAEEEAEEEEGRRRCPNTLSSGAERGPRPSDARRWEPGPGQPAAPLPVPAPHGPGTKLPRATGPEGSRAGRVLWPRRRRRREGSASGERMGGGTGGGAHGGDLSTSGGGGGGAAARGDAAAVGRDGRAQ